MHEILATVMVLRAGKDRGVRIYLTWCLEFKNGIFQVSCIYLKKQKFWYNGTCILSEICRFRIQNVKFGQIWPRRFNGLEKTKLEPKFEVSSSKNKKYVQQSGYQKIWKIALSHLFGFCFSWTVLVENFVTYQFDIWTLD